MNNILNPGKVVKSLEYKRKDVSFMAYKILSIMLSHYEARLEKDPSNNSNITYRNKKQNQDLYNKNDLDQLTRLNAKYMMQGRTYYYMTVVQFLDQFVFGINGVNVNISRHNNVQTTELCVPRKLMDEKYELVKALVHHIKPLIDKTRLKKDKTFNKKKNNTNVIINDEITVPEQKITIELEDNSKLPTIL